MSHRNGRLRSSHPLRSESGSAYTATLVRNEPGPLCQAWCCCREGVKSPRTPHGHPVFGVTAHPVTLYTTRPGGGER